jgi:hypothetical protein
MPISLSIDPNNTGVPATYWVVTRIQIDFVNTVANLTICGYGSYADYAAGMSPMYTQGVTQSGAQDPLTTTSLATALNNLYHILLNYPMFSGGTIVS